MNKLTTSHHDDGKISLLVHTNVTLFQADTYPHPKATYERLFPPEDVAEALHGLDFPICAHLRLNHAFILSRYNPRCLFTLTNGHLDPCRCGQTNTSGGPLPPGQNPRRAQCYHRGYCPTCEKQGLSTAFVIGVYEDNRRVATGLTRMAVWLTRSLDILEGSNHPSWLTHTVEPRALEYMASIWLDWGDHITDLRRKRLEWFEQKFAPNTPGASPTTYPSSTEAIGPQKTSNENRNSSNERLSTS
jgi:hypothetical protein